MPYLLSGKGVRVSWWCLDWGWKRGFRKGGHTFAAEKYGEVPELGHVECFKYLALVAGTVSVEADCCVGVILVLIGKRNTGTNRYLSADYTIAAVETFCEHVH